MPITAFIGVRISWLMVARNADLAAAAAIASSRAATIAVIEAFTARAIWASSWGPVTSARRLRSPSATRCATAVTRWAGAVIRRVIHRAQHATSAAVATDTQRISRRVRRALASLSRSSSARRCSSSACMELTSSWTSAMSEFTWSGCCRSAAFASSASRGWRTICNWSRRRCWTGSSRLTARTRCVWVTRVVEAFRSACAQLALPAFW